MKKKPADIRRDCVVLFLYDSRAVQKRAVVEALFAREREKGRQAVYYTSFIITFSYSLAQQLWGHLLNFDWLVN